MIMSSNRDKGRKRVESVAISGRKERASGREQKVLDRGSKGGGKEVQKNKISRRKRVFSDSTGLGKQKRRDKGK